MNPDRTPMNLITAWCLAVALVSSQASSQQPFVLGPQTQQKSNSLGGLPASSNAPAGSQVAERPSANSNGSSGSVPKSAVPQVAARINRRSGSPSPETVGKEFEPGTLVANVGGYPIFRGDVMADINQLIEGNMAGAPEAIKKQQREMALPFAVDRAIEQKLLFVDAIRSLPDPSKLNEIRNSIREQFVELRLPELMKNLKAQNPAEVEAKLRKLGTSLRQARDAWVDGQLAGFFVREKIDMNPEISHFEMLEYYNTHRQDYHVPAQVRWEQIMVRFDKFPSRQEAWDFLGKLGNEVIYGANFSAVAKKSSQGFKADQGGYHDWTTKGSLAQESVDQALFMLPVNRLSDRIESEIGFHIVRVIERKEEGYTPFSECQDEIREKIKKRKQNDSLKKYIERLKKEIPFEKYVPDAKLPARK